MAGIAAVRRMRAWRVSLCLAGSSPNKGLFSACSIALVLITVYEVAL